MQKLRPVASKIPGQLYLWIAILIFGAANSVTHKLTEIGTRHFIDGRNPISLCNVLFVGNICALLVAIAIYRKQLKPNKLKQISRQEWLNLSLVAIMSGAIAPGFIFQALALTTVNSVILVGRLEPPLTLILSVWLLGERVNFWESLGGMVAFIGVILSIFLQPSEQGAMMMGFHVAGGEILTAIAAVALAASTIISKAKLSQVPIGIYNTVRTALGTVIFFFLALLIYGHNHFMDVFSPFLWKWMLIYGPIIVVVGQSLWISGLRASTVSQASLAGSFTPVAGVATAYLILGEVPTTAQYIGGGVILIGIFLSQFGIWRKESSKCHSSADLQEVESGIGFKGL
jgi:drug/metabolite transporter (DMT)-like permease